MTLVGLEYLKHQESARSNRANEALKGADIAARVDTADKDRYSKENIASLDRDAKVQVADKDRESRERIADQDRATKEDIANKDRASKEAIEAGKIASKEGIAEADRALKQKVAAAGAYERAGLRSDALKTLDPNIDNLTYYGTAVVDGIELAEKILNPLSTLIPANAG